MPEINHPLADLLLQIEAELRSLELWGETAPAASALMSATPFCADTLHLNQWLQWLFVPRMKAILEQSLPLPQQCDIHSYAEAGSLVPEGKVLESGYLYLGRPAKQVRPLTEAEIVYFDYSAWHYVRLAQSYQIK